MDLTMITGATHTKKLLTWQNKIYMVEKQVGRNEKQNINFILVLTQAGYQHTLLLLLV